MAFYISKVRQTMYLIDCHDIKLPKTSILYTFKLGKSVTNRDMEKYFAITGQLD